MKTRELFNFLPLINNSVTTGLSFLLLTISIFQYFYKYHPYNLQIQ